MKSKADKAGRVKSAPTQTMPAVVLEGVNRLEIRQVPVPQPAAGEVVVSCHAAALNHRDVWIKRGEYAGSKFPIIPGSDGAGVITRLGSDVSADWVGRRVIINPGLDWGNDQRAQGSRFSDRKSTRLNSSHRTISYA